ncbi:EthD domain-containing protein [Thiogranum longum]|jgi:hypothetical protein
MIRYINCFRKKAGMTDEEFRQFWCNAEYNELVNEVALLSGATRHAKNLTLKVEATQRLIHDRGMGAPYDAVLEYWWQDAAQLMPLYESPEAKALLDRVSEYQNQFIDLTGSTAFFTEDDS